MTETSTQIAPAEPKPDLEPSRPAPPFPARPDDAVRQAQLDVMKRRATGLLAGAFGVLVVARIFEFRYPWLRIVAATAEASVVGGLADWFAVTALFRKPLGLPIPHTAIVPTHKDRIGRIIGNFVQNHFLARDVLATRLRGLRLTERAARWISEPENSARIARQVASAVVKAVESVPDEQIRELIRNGASDRIRATPVAPALGKALSVVVAGNHHAELLDQALRLAAGAVRDNHELIRDRVKAESPWWVPSAIDNKIYQRIIGAIERLLEGVGSDPNHPLRVAFDRALRDFTDRLAHSPELKARAEALKSEWLDDAAIADLATWVWDTTRQGLTSYATRTDQDAPGPLDRSISAFGASLAANGKLLAEFEELLIERILTVVEEHRHEAGDLIAHTVAGWDPDATSRRIELAVGRDLQFIRINGTLVGGLVGLVIFLVTEFAR
jgi:uncharacterized membrane-anchored protein YjiN (DUF445 family)